MKYHDTNDDKNLSTVIVMPNLRLNKDIKLNIEDSKSTLQVLSIKINEALIVVMIQLQGMYRTHGQIHS